jgi:hypothetical protein
MIKRAFVIAFGFLGFCFPLMAQQTKRVERTKDETGTPRQLRPSALDTPARLILSRPEVFSAMHDSSFTDAYVTLALFNGPRLPASSEVGWTGMPPLDFEDDLPSVARGQKAEVARMDGKDSPAEMVSSPLSPIYYGGELGIFYGRWNGKYSGDTLQTYIRGDIGNEKFHISVGAAYGESNVDLPRSYPYFRSK